MPVDSNDPTSCLTGTDGTPIGEVGNSFFGVIFADETATTELVDDRKFIDRPTQETVTVIDQGDLREIARILVETLTLTPTVSRFLDPAPTEETVTLKGGERREITRNDPSRLEQITVVFVADRREVSRVTLDTLTLSPIVSRFLDRFADLETLTVSQTDERELTPAPLSETITLDDNDLREISLIFEETLTLAPVVVRELDRLTEETVTLSDEDSRELTRLKEETVSLSVIVSRFLDRFADLESLTIQDQDLREITIILPDEGITLSSDDRRALHRVAAETLTVNDDLRRELTRITTETLTLDAQALAKKITGDLELIFQSVQDLLFYFHMWAPLIYGPHIQDILDNITVVEQS